MENLVVLPEEGTGREVVQFPGVNMLAINMLAVNNLVVQCFYIIPIYLCNLLPFSNRIFVFRI